MALPDPTEPPDNVIILDIGNSISKTPKQTPDTPKSQTNTNTADNNHETPELRKNQTNEMDADSEFTHSTAKDEPNANKIALLQACCAQAYS